MNTIPKIPDDRKTKVLNAVRSMQARFCFVPSPMLKEMVAKNEHPFITVLPTRMKQDILECGPNEGIGALDRYLVEKYILGTLDERQRFILDLSDVRVLGCPIGTRPDVVL